MDAIKQRFLNDRVLTATPAQRVVMLYDRLSLDLTRARSAVDDGTAADPHLEHATLIVAELLGSLDQSVAGPAANLASVYGWMLGELTTARLSSGAGHHDLTALEANVRTLREAWVTVAAEVATVAANVAAAACATAGDAATPVLAAAWTA